MIKPQKLEVSTDYRLALLWLMDLLESARVPDVLAAFEETFGDFIPTEHREKNQSGYVKWQHYTTWSRLVLVNAGLIGSGGRGVWTITPEGRAWLREHPEASPSDLAAEIRQRGESVAEGFRWGGKWYTVRRDELLDQARALLTQDPPPEAFRYRTWAVFIDGQPVNAKWLFALATRTEDYGTFHSPEARRALSKIGIEAQRVDRQASEDAPAPVSRAERKAQRQAFLEQIAEQLPQHLSEQTRHGEVSIPAGKNIMQLVYPEFRGAHYEVTLGRRDDQLGLHFEASREKNRARLRVFVPHQESLSSETGYEVVAEPWGKNWARVITHQPSAVWTLEQAQGYAQFIGRFVDVTYLLLRQAFDAVPPGRRGRRAKKPIGSQGWQDSRPYVILEEQMAKIHLFLQGRADRPTDEVLCDWVQFCYTFEMYAEGHELFKLVDPSSVNDWLYKRTKKLAEVCRVRSR